MDNQVRTYLSLILINPNSQIGTNTLRISYGSFIEYMRENYSEAYESITDTDNEINIIDLVDMIYRVWRVYLRKSKSQYYRQILALSVCWFLNVFSIEENMEIFESIHLPDKLANILESNTNYHDCLEMIDEIFIVLG